MIPLTVIGNTKRIHFTGIGGIGMSGLAEYFLRKGYKVSGSDITPSHITERLKKLGAEIFIGHSKENVKSIVDKVVYTSAVHGDNPEIQRAKELNIKTVRRAELLGEVVNDKFLIAVSGTHGKTTTTAMIAKVLADAGLDPLVFVGGNVQLFEGGSTRTGEGNYAVVEADEYDRSFLTLKPDIAVVTSIDEDHLDIYKDLDDIKMTFKEFCNKSKKGSKVVYFGDDENVVSALSNLNKEKVSYGFNDSNFLRISDYSLNRGNQIFTFYNSHNSYKNVSLKLIGIHNVLNSAACFAVCNTLGIEFSDFKKSIKGFEPVDRRLQLKSDKGRVKVYDDYAHHPKEIKVSLNGLKSIAKGRLITVFQPHLYSRTKDFYKEFAESLSIADEVVLMEIYPAREKPIKGVTSELVFNELIKLNSKVKYFKNNKSILSYLKKDVKSNDTVVFQGAGDITKLCDEFVKEISEKSK
jgi:UDP-N-acetylmuramate--alanine ligase